MSILLPPSPLFPLTISFPSPAFGLKLSVIIPVQNEAQTLAKTLTALACQVTASGTALDPACYEVLLLANNCSDETAEIARCFARRAPHLALHVAEILLPSSQAHVGTARRLLMDEACRRLLQCGQSEGVIASTDGDTRVAVDWVYQTLREVSAGADAVGGRIHIESHRGGDREARLYCLRDQQYQRGLAKLECSLDPDPADPWPRHHQFFGGSLAITASAYCRVGGLPVLPCLEDVALGNALQRMDARVRHSPAVRVRTSARQDGRIALGLSTQLRDWGAMGRTGQSHWVQQPAAIEARLRARHRLRRCRHQGTRTAEALAEDLAVPASVIQKGLENQSQSFGALWAEVLAYHRNPDGAWARRWPLIEIVHALPDLRRRIAQKYQTRSSTSRR